MKTGGWQAVSNAELSDVEPTFMGMLGQTPKWVLHIYFGTSTDRKKLTTIDRDT